MGVFFGYNVLRISLSKVLLSPELQSLCNIANDGLLEKSFYVSAYYSCKWKYLNKLLSLLLPFAKKTPSALSSVFFRKRRINGKSQNFKLFK